MGLDIYLYEAAQHAQNEEHQRIWNEYYEHPDYEKWSDAERDQHRSETQDRVSDRSPQVDVLSATHPDNICNRRYLRSSYNNGGFNSVVWDGLNVEGFHHIFEPLGREWDGDPGVLTGDDIPALTQARERAQQVAVDLRKAEILRTINGSVLLAPMSHCWQELPTEHEVLDWYRDEQARSKQRKSSEFFGESYSNAKGRVLGFTEGMEVLALTLGRDIIGRPVAYAVYRMPEEHKEHYIASAEVCTEFIDEAIELIKRDGSVHISWSG